MVLLSFKSHMNFYLIIFTYCEQWRFVYKLFLHLSLSCSVCVFALLHSSIACHKLFGINLKERKKDTQVISVQIRIKLNIVIKNYIYVTTTSSLFKCACQPLITEWSGNSVNLISYFTCQLLLDLP